MKWQELLETLPEDAAERAARARRRALARLDEGKPARRWGWSWAPALASAVVLVVAGGAWLTGAWRVETLAWTPPAPAPPSEVMVSPVMAERPPAVRAARKPRPRPAQREMQVHLALSDGTRVYWTLDDNFILRGTS